MDTNSHLMKGAIANAIINAVINGAIYWFQVRDKDTVLLTDNLISSDKHTVFSGAVILAASLAFILSCVAYMTTKKEGKAPFFPDVLGTALKNAVFAFGIVTITGILIQRYAGSVEVTTLSATIITGMIAGVVAGMVDYLTKKSL